MTNDVHFNRQLIYICLYERVKLAAYISTHFHLCFRLCLPTIIPIDLRLFCTNFQRAGERTARTCVHVVGKYEPNLPEGARVHPHSPNIVVVAAACPLVLVNCCSQLAPVSSVL